MTAFELEMANEQEEPPIFHPGKVLSSNIIFITSDEAQLETD